MSNSITYDPASNLIVVTLNGVIDRAVMDELTEKTLSLVKQHSCFRVLADVRQARSAVSTLDLFKRAKETAEIVAQANIPASYKRALVVGPELTDPIFYETVAQNRDQQVRVFREMGEAKQWLLQ